MAGKQILGDDPFATGDDKEAPPPVEVAAEVKAKGKKLNGDKATLADSVAADATVEHGPPPPVQETYTPVETRPPSEYGPSIDRPPPAGQRHGLVDEVKHIEKSGRDRNLP